MLSLYGEHEFTVRHWDTYIYMYGLTYIYILYGLISLGCSNAAD